MDTNTPPSSQPSIPSSPLSSLPPTPSVASPQFGPSTPSMATTLGDRGHASHRYPSPSSSLSSLSILDFPDLSSSASSPIPSPSTPTPPSSQQPQPQPKPRHKLVSSPRGSNTLPKLPPSFPDARINGNCSAPAQRQRAAAAPRVRRTEHLDLAAAIDEGRIQDDALVQQLMRSLRRKKKIVVVAGAGISVSAGVPDFRSARGLFKSAGKELFDASVYRHDDSTESFHKMVRELGRLSRQAKPTEFHHMVASLAHEGRLLRLYSQNVDCIDTSLEPLKTRIPLNAKGPWPKTIQLHGGLGKMVCTKCSALDDFDPSLFDGPEPPPCRHCEAMELARSAGELRGRGVGRLRPRMVLYNEFNPDADAIGSVSEADLRKGADAVLVVGTSLKIPGVRRLVKELCLKTRSRRDGFTAWINTDPEPQGVEFKDCFDLVVRGSCEDVAVLAGLPRWDSSEKDRHHVLSDEEARQLCMKRSGRDRIEVCIPVTSAPRPEKPGEGEKSAGERTSRVAGIPTPGASPKLCPKKNGAKGRQTRLVLDSKSDPIKTDPSTTKIKATKSRPLIAKGKRTPLPTARGTKAGTKAAPPKPAANTVLATFKAGKQSDAASAPPVKAPQKRKAAALDGVENDIRAADAKKAAGPANKRQKLPVAAQLPALRLTRTPEPVAGPPRL